MADQPEKIGGWEVLRKLGEGGQGKVYLARSERAAERRRERLRKFFNAVRQTSAGITSRQSEVDLEAATAELLEAKEPDDLGAAKVYSIERATAGVEAARKRLKKEIEVLFDIDHPGIIRPRAAAGRGDWLVTEYHSRGTLADHPLLFKGDALGALLAVHQVVEALGLVHDRGVVHRDIKPANIFIAEDGRLVLGDFGILYFEDKDRTRITETPEKVGSSDWMPPWAHTGQRLDDVPKNFDLFAIGKVLWSMIAGRQVLPFWYWDRPQYNLQALFPDQSEMQTVNEILRQTVVEESGKCCPSATVLLSRLDRAISIVRRRGVVLRPNRSWPCRVCGIGYYESIWNERVRALGLPDWADVPPRNTTFQLDKLFRQESSISVRAFRCPVCGHVEMFSWERPAPVAWRED